MREGAAAAAAVMMTMMMMIDGGQERILLVYRSFRAAAGHDTRRLITREKGIDRGCALFQSGVGGNVGTKWKILFLFKSFFFGIARLIIICWCVDLSLLG